MFIKKASLKLQVEAAAGLLPERGHPPDDPQGDDESHADRQHDQGPPWLPHTTEIPVDAEFNAHRQKPSRPDDQGNGGECGAPPAPEQKDRPLPNYSSCRFSGYLRG